MQKATIFCESNFSLIQSFDSFFLLIFYLFFIPTVLLAIVACEFATLVSSSDNEKNADMQKIGEHRQRLNSIKVSNGNK